MTNRARIPVPLWGACLLVACKQSASPVVPPPDPHATPESASKSKASDETLVNEIAAMHDNQPSTYAFLLYGSLDERRVTKLAVTDPEDGGLVLMVENIDFEFLGPPPVFEKLPLLEFVDIDFDGYRDIQLLTGVSGDGDNHFSYWTYYPEWAESRNVPPFGEGEKPAFEYTNPKVSHDTERIVCEYRDGGKDFRLTYGVEEEPDGPGRSIELLEKVVTTYDGRAVKKTTHRRVDGALVPVAP